MSFQLIVIGGPLKGHVFDIPEQEVSIGRASSNPVFIRDPALSREHCRLSRAGDRVTLRDLDSLHGTFVGDVPIKERVLQHGDEIRVGASVLLFLDTSQNRTNAGSPIEEQRVGSGTTVALSEQEAELYRPQRMRHLNVLLTLGSALIPIHDPEQLQKQLLRLLIDALPADRGAVLLQDRGGELQPSATLDPVAARPVAIDRDLAGRVLQRGAPLMTNDVGHQQVRSLLCAPLSAFDHVLGVLYLTTATRDFDVEDLQFISAAAGIAAVALHNASHVRALEDERDRLRTDAGRERKLLGESPSMRAVDERIDKLARADSTVLIHGETGTGKELAARAIHQRSPRARHPFIDVNCAAIPRDLVENELFGHEKGGFSNATTQKKGLVELADGGTLFLDEIGDLPLELQPKLLRVLQEREFRRVGGTATIRVDIRVIVATNRDLKQAIDAGTFREDLFHRLTIDLWMPPLRDRQDDILLLALFFVQKHSRRCGRRIDGIAADALAALQAYEWRGNVRELENVIEQAAVIGSSTEVRLKDLPPRVQKATAAPQTRGELHKATQGAKEDAVRRALERTNYDYAEAAAWLGIHVNALHRLIKALGIPKKPRR